MFARHPHGPETLDALHSASEAIALAIGRSRTEEGQSRLVSELERASRVKSEFLSTMSHELRTPLNVILGFAEMARDQGFEWPQREGFVLAIEKAGRQLLELVDDTLAIGKLDAGRDEPRFEDVHLPPFWRRLGTGCASMPRKPGVLLEWGTVAPDVMIHTDPRKLTVVVRNLVSNALKFTEHGFVGTRVWMDGDVVSVAVTDTGIGIRPEDQEAIFEMFRQADGSDARAFDGAGLGLYLVRQFVQQLGGAVVLESAPGRGSTFTVTLPRAGVMHPAEVA
jgi:signal transduction histidine kinase